MLSQLFAKAQATRSVRPALCSAGSFVRHSLNKAPLRRLPISTCTTPGASAEVKIAIEGMMCDGCSSRIEKVLKGMEFVKNVSVSLEGKVATVHLAKGAAGTPEAVAAATALVDTINGMGFEAKLGQ